jgi:hypothetical protein
VTREGRLIVARGANTITAVYARRRGSFLLLGDAATQRLHEIHHAPRCGKRRLALLHGTPAIAVSKDTDAFLNGLAP